MRVLRNGLNTLPPSRQQILIRKLMFLLRFVETIFYFSKIGFGMFMTFSVSKCFRSVSVEIAEANELNELKPSTSCISLVTRELNGPDSGDNQTAIVYFNAEVVLIT